MKQYDNTNSGMMKRNENRQSDRHPEFTGSLNVEGVDYWVSAWVNTGRDGGSLEGKKYFSLKINRKEQSARPTPKPQQSMNSGFDIDDDIPF